MMFNEPLMNPATKLLVNAFIKNPTNSLGINGPQGSGKTRVAQYLAIKILEIEPSQYDFQVKNVDLSEDGIDKVRSLKKELFIKSAGAAELRRSVILSNFDKMSVPAQNSILKILEEPPADTILIILTNSKSNVLPTITSRLQWINNLPLDLSVFRKRYHQYDESTIKQAYLLSDGYWLSFESAINEKDTPIKHAVSDAKKILKMQKPERLSNIDKIIKKQEYTPEDFLDALKKIYMTLLRKEESDFTRKRIIYGLDEIMQTKESLNYNPNLKLSLTNLLYKI